MPVSKRNEVDPEQITTMAENAFEVLYDIMSTARRPSSLVVGDSEDIKRALRRLMILARDCTELAVIMDSALGRVLTEEKIKAMKGEP